MVRFNTFTNPSNFKLFYFFNRESYSMAPSLLPFSVWKSYLSPIIQGLIQRGAGFGLVQDRDHACPMSMQNRYRGGIKGLSRSEIEFSRFRRCK